MAKKKAAPETSAEAAPAAAEYTVLARRYRPQQFGDLVGQDPVAQALGNAIKTNRIAHAYLFTGARGVGKTSTARILAKCLNCVKGPTTTPCDECDMCRAITSGDDVDVIEIDGASNRGIDEVREIRSNVQYRPQRGRYKIYIIDEVHMLTTPAFNALLKTLEEPPPHVKFIFATTEASKIPITILSRCQRFDLRRVDAGTLTANLRNIATLEEIEVDDDALAMIARAAEGSVRDAQSILDQAIAHGAGRVTAEAVRSMLGLADRARIVDLFEHVMKGDAAAALNEFRAQYDTGADPVAVLTDLAEFNHLVTRLRFVPSAADDASLSEEERRRGREFAQALSVRVLSRSWQMLLKGIPEVQASNRPVSAAEMVLIRLAHASDLPTLDEALKSLGDGPSPSVASTPRPPPPSASPAGPNNGASAVAQSRIPAGNGGGQTMRLVAAEPAPAEMPKPEPVAEAAPPPAVQIKSLADLVALADTHRDMAFKVLVRRCVRLVKIEPGRLDVSLTGDAPKTLLGDLTVKLKAWTGRNWLVSLSREDGGQTLAEQETSKRENAFQDARSDPAVAAILARFPGAKIIDVRIPDAPDIPNIDADLPPEAVTEDDDEN